MSNRGSIVLANQPETRIYTGETGQIVIKQEDWQEQTMIIIIDPVHAETVCKAIMAEVEIAKATQQEWRESDESA